MRTATRIALLASVALASPALAFGDPAASDAAAADASAVGVAETSEDAEIVVFGKGEVRQVTEVEARDIKLVVAGGSPFLAIQKLPGVNFQSADPFGVYEWSTRITLRGFNQNQLGFTLDGVPLGDMSYGNTNGLHISRAIIADNIGRTRVSQGAGALGTASVSNLGGTIEFFSRAPQDKAGIAANATYGDSNTLRLFGTLDTGNIGGFKAYISGAIIDADKWKGFGTQRATQVNAKGVLDIGEGKGSFTAFLNYSDRKENDYQDFSLNMLNRLGPFWDNISDNWPLAVQVATIAANRGDTGVTVAPNTLGTTYPSPIQTVDDAYYDAAGLRRDWLAGARLEGELTAGLNAGVQAYYHNNRGQGSWITPYVASPGGVPLSFRTTEYVMDRWGILGDLTANLAEHTVKLTAWYEQNDYEQARRFYSMGSSATEPATSAITYQTNPFFTQWNNRYRTHIFQFSVQDTFEVGSDVSISWGFKGQSVRLSANAINPTPGPLATGTISSEDLFLPQVGILWKLDGNNEVFAGFTENQRGFVAAATTGPFASSAAGFDVLRGQIKPEKSNTFEAGFRFGAGSLRGVLSAYLVNFSNRLLAIPQGAGIIGNAPILSNVGDVRSQGVELGVQWQPVKTVTITASYALNDNSYRDDVVNAAGVVVQAVRGRTVVDSPRHIGNLEIVYDDGNFYGRANANGMSKRFFTFSNDQSVGGRVIVDGKIGYRITSDSRWLNGLAIEATVTNLFDRRYVSTIGTNGFGFAGDNQTLLPAPPRQFFLTLRKDY